MCYSAIVTQHLKTLERYFGAEIEWQMFEDLFFSRIEDSSIKISRALEANFDRPESEISQRIKGYIDTYRASLIQNWQQDLFKQKKRLADAQRTLQTKETNKAANDQRIATKKVKDIIDRLADLQRTGPKTRDSQIFPMGFAPVIVQDGRHRLIRPMRYHCRPAGMPASLDKTHEGLYNARRDSLTKFWRGLYRQHHAIMVVSSFYENVKRHRYEQRDLKPGEDEQNMVLHFNPQPPSEMLIACLWSRWEEAGGKPLYSFAAVTDEPPPEIAATGHDRCIIAIKEANIDEWLNAQGVSHERLQEILSDQQSPFYEHRIAA